MTKKQLPGIEWDSSKLLKIEPENNVKKPIFILKKMMAEYVWDITKLGLVHHI